MAVLEETACYSHVKRKGLRDASVDEESDREHRLGVCGVVARRYEAEIWVRGDGVLDALEAELGGDGKVVGAGPKFIAKRSELSDIGEID